MNASNSLIRGLFLALLLSQLVSARAASVSDEAPLGLWVWRALEPPRTVSLVVEKKDETWHAIVNSERLPAVQEGDCIAFKGPRDSRFEGKFSANSSALNGHWFQPPSPLNYQ